MSNKKSIEIDRVLGDLINISEDKKEIRKFSFHEYASLNKTDIYFLALRFQNGFDIKKNIFIAENCYEYIHYNYEIPFNFGEYNYEVIESPDGGVSLLGHLLVLFELKKLNNNYFVDDDGIDWFDDECLILLASAAIVYNQIWPLAYLKTIKLLPSFDNYADPETYLINNNVVDAFNSLLDLALRSCEHEKFMKK
jgi:hypothetical protein